MICLKLATRTGSFQVEVDATPADCGVANINYERKPLAVPGTRNTGTNYADSRYQLPQIDNRVLCLGQAVLPTGQVEVDELKARRIERQLSQAQVAEKLGCAPARISDIETGKRPLPELRLAYEELLKSA